MPRTNGARMIGTDLGDLRTMVDAFTDLGSTFAEQATAEPFQAFTLVATRDQLASVPQEAGVATVVVARGNSFHPVKRHEAVGAGLARTEAGPGQNDP